LREEPIWNGYFDRFRQAYDLLTRMLIEDGHAEEAFAYNDQAHGAEPLDLIVQSGLAPVAVRDLAATPAPKLPAKLQALLPADTFLIEYRVLDDLTYAWVISRNAFRLVPLQPTRAEVERWVLALQDAAAANDAAGFANGLYEPYDKLLSKPLKAVAEMSKGATVRLVIIPDDFMHGLPFAALRDPITRRYLIEDRTISIAGSGVLYAFSLLRDAAIAPSPPSALLIGDPAFDPKFGHDAPPLPAARKEVNDLRQFYSPVEVLMARDATPTRFLGDAAKNSIIHVAAHAVTNGELPRDSYLLLAPDKGDSGVLDAERLQKELHLTATRLVVLGACRSVGSNTVGPQGVAPLVRPFLAAGVPGVIGTLWNINDATAKELLVSFHRHYRQGSDAAAALRAAQIDLLKTSNPGLSPELTWGAYQAIGFASSPSAPAGEKKKEKPP
jgi:CHAT domain-containing protein